MRAPRGILLRILDDAYGDAIVTKKHALDWVSDEIARRNRREAVQVIAFLRWKFPTLYSDGGISGPRDQRDPWSNRLDDGGRECDIDNRRIRDGGKSTLYRWRPPK